MPKKTMSRIFIDFLVIPLSVTPPDGTDFTILKFTRILVIWPTMAFLITRPDMLHNEKWYLKNKRPYQQALANVDILLYHYLHGLKENWHSYLVNELTSPDTFE